MLLVPGDAASDRAVGNGLCAVLLHTEERKGLKLKGLSSWLLSHLPKAQASVSSKDTVQLAAAT